MRFFGIRHEGAASFAAGAYGKLTGLPAACFAIAGPGSTNLLTGLYDAKVDRAPVLAVTGPVPSAVAGRECVCFNWICVPQQIQSVRVI